MSFVADLSALVGASVDHRHCCPEGWSRVPLGSVAQIINGFPFKSGGFGAVGHPVIRIRDVARGFTNTRFDGNAPADYWVEAGDLIVGMDGDFQTAFWRSEPALLNQRVCKVIPDQTRIDRRYLAYILPGYLELINVNTPSVTVKHLSSRTLASIPLPLPPLDRQKAIAARIDELFAEIDDGEAALARARDDLTTWRKALLKAAVTGELTADWRAANPQSETGTDLLSRILEERREQWAETPKNKGKRYVQPSALDEAGLPPLPNAWTWTTAEVAGSVQQGRQRAPAHHAGDHMRPYLRVANVMEGRLDLRDVKSMNFTPDEYETYRLFAGDVLLNEGQSPELLGRPAIYNDEIPGACFQNTLLRFRPSGHVRSDFALIVFRRHMHAHRFLKESRITTNLAHLTLGRFRVVEFPVPPLAEQTEIARLVNEAEAAWDRDTLGAPIADGLRQSILAAAFRGELA